MKYTFDDFISHFGTDDACLDFLFLRRYGPKPKCPGCQRKNLFYRVRHRRSYSCSRCRHQLYPTADTIFHKSSTGLRKWFFAIFLMSQSKNGVAAKEIERQVGVTYKTAWRMQGQIRQLMAQGPELLSGVVEVDEVYLGGKWKNWAGRRPKTKVPVVGLVERSGRLKMVISDLISSASLSKIVQTHVVAGTRVITDDLAAYKRLGKLGYEHDSINHSKKIYAEGDVHTNTIEGFWAQLRRSLHGTHHFVSRRHLSSYLDEFSWKYSHRMDSDPWFLSLLTEAAKNQPPSPED